MISITERPSPNHGERLPESGAAVVVDMLVVHYTGMVPDARALDWLCDPEEPVLDASLLPTTRLFLPLSSVGLTGRPVTNGRRGRMLGEWRAMSRGRSGVSKAATRGRGGGPRLLSRC